MSLQRSSRIATVMFTDVEASTATTTRLGDDAASALFAAHKRIVRELIREHDGRHVESTGDGFMVVFDSARRALSCALAIQREGAERQDGIRVRIGLNAGELLEDDDALFGAAINLAQRVMDRADGGQILMSDAVRQLLGTVPGVQFRDRGRVALKGFPERQRLHEARSADGRPAPRPRPAPGPRSYRRPLAALGLALGVAILAIVLTLARDEKAVNVLPNSVAMIDPRDGGVVDQFPVGRGPIAVAVGDGSSWVANTLDGTVTRIDRSRDEVVTIDVGPHPTAIAFGAGSVWVAEGDDARVTQIDPASNRVV